MNMNTRGRPIKPRNIRRQPHICQFSPRGKAGRPDEIDLKLEEFEAIKLADFIGLSQKKAAAFMGISQQTFSRILRRARKSLASALISGKIIKIQGGNYRISSQNYTLQDAHGKEISEMTHGFPGVNPEEILYKHPA